MRILLTGASGFVGRHALGVLAEEHDVVAIGRDPTGERVPGTWLSLDLSTPLDAARLPPAVDAVVHLAQSRRYREFPEGVGDVVAVNARATADLLEYAHAAGARRFVLASTGGVYPPGRPAAEHDVLPDPAPGGPLSHYLLAKRAAEQIAGAYAGVLSVAVLRPFWVYGPGQRAMLVGTLAGRIVAAEAVSASPMQLNPIFVTDAARAVAAAVTAEASGTFNLAGDETVSVRELAELLVELAGTAAEIEPAAANGDLVARNDRMRTELGVAPAVGLREGLTALIDWLRS